MRKISQLLVLMLIAAGLIIPGTAYTKDAHDHHDHHDHQGHNGHHIHEAGGFEIGLSIGWVRLEEDGHHHEEEEHHEEGEHHEEEEHHEEDGHSEDALGVHLHIGKRLADEGILSKVSLGIGGEVIFSEEEHYGLMAFATVHPWKGLKLSVGPAIEWAKHDGEWDSHYATHMEAAYVFDVDEIHIGPAFGYSTSDHGEHYSVGLHIGYHL